MASADDKDLFGSSKICRALFGVAERHGNCCGRTWMPKSGTTLGSVYCCWVRRLPGSPVPPISRAEAKIEHRMNGGGLKSDVEERL